MRRRLKGCARMATRYGSTQECSGNLTPLTKRFMPSSTCGLAIIIITLKWRSFCHRWRGSQVCTKEREQMSIGPAKLAEPGPISESGSEAAPHGGFKMFNRIVDWITSDRMQLINITDRINEIVRKSGVRDGIVHLQSLHTTTAVFINEWQDALLHDVRNFLDDLVVREQAWRHNDPNFSDCERKN